MEFGGPKKSVEAAHRVREDSRLAKVRSMPCLERARLLREHAGATRRLPEAVDTLAAAHEVGIEAFFGSFQESSTAKQSCAGTREQLDRHIQEHRCAPSLLMSPK